MLLIPCPWCGPRDEPEFQFGGEPATRPSADVTDETWANYLYLKNNRKGGHRELWCHAGGCGQWFTLERDTLTHEIFPGAAR
jgi:heterotetrameric sarcosine oxidase delta subunit